MASAAPVLAAARAAGDRAPLERPGLAVYLHWPFCLSKCPYCDFNSHVRASIDQTRWRRALLRELDHCAERLPGRRVTSVFFGGGTPSLMPPATVGELLERIATHWPSDPDLEVTLEANPTSAEAGRFAEVRAAGVSRLSLGVQALDDTALRFLGRQHDSAEALAAIALARRSFPRMSFDLIYARPGQSAEDWAAELRRALLEAPEHLSLYQLTIEPGTPFHAARRRGELPLPDEEHAAAQFELTQDLLAQAGLPAYEISNHARPGAACRHNLTYWRYGEYVGIGPGAHGRIEIAGAKHAMRQHRAPEIWLQRVEAAGHGTVDSTPLSRDERLRELTLLGLRLTDGIRLEDLRRELGATPEALYAPERLSALVSAGYLVRDDAGLRATPEGRRRLDALVAHLLS